MAIDVKLEFTVGHIHNIGTPNIGVYLNAVEGLLAHTLLTTGGGALRNARHIESEQKIQSLSKNKNRKKGHPYSSRHSVLQGRCSIFGLANISQNCGATFNPWTVLTQAG